jgi:hypothetical protein
MSTKNNEIFKMGDDLIAVVRELVQLSLITGTNIVDHLRAIHVEVDGDSGKLIPTVDYVNAYNEMVQELQKQAEAAAKAYEEQLLAAEKEASSN